MVATRPIREIYERYLINRCLSLLTAIKLQMFGYQACHVCILLEPVSFLTCPRLGKNDGNNLFYGTYRSPLNINRMGQMNILQEK